MTTAPETVTEPNVSVQEEATASEDEHLKPMHHPEVREFGGECIVEVLQEAVTFFREHFPDGIPTKVWSPEHSLFTSQVAYGTFMWFYNQKHGTNKVNMKKRKKLRMLIRGLTICTIAVQLDESDKFLCAKFADHFFNTEYGSKHVKAIGTHMLVNAYQAAELNRKLYHNMLCQQLGWEPMVDSPMEQDAE